MWLSFVASAFAVGACAKSHDVSGSPGALEGDALQGALSATCRSELDDSDDSLPESLECTGLYTDLEDKTVSKAVREFAPAHVLWSDGAAKRRWIYLPKDETIDATDPDSWVFPEGTRVWKEFSLNGRRIETRLFQKVESNHWSKTTYAWNARETAATRSAGQDIMVGNQPYRIPSATECDECHSGRRDRVLGFEQALLGLPGAQGVSLAELVSEGLLDGFSGPTSYEIGADPNAVAANALGWLHANCGVSCHNDNPASKGNTRGMRLHLNPGLLDGRDVGEFPSVATTVDQDAATLRWFGLKRVVAGSPEESLMYELVTQRAEGEQMPPLASRLVDEEFAPVLAQWIRSLAAPEEEPESSD